MSDFESPLDKDLEQLGKVAPLRADRAAALRRELVDQIETTNQDTAGDIGRGNIGSAAPTNGRSPQSWLLMAAAVAVLLGAVGVFASALRNSDVVTLESIRPAAAVDDNNQSAAGTETADDEAAGREAVGNETTDSEQAVVVQPPTTPQDQPAVAVEPTATPTAAPTPTPTPTPQPTLEPIAQDPATIGLPVAALASGGPPSLSDEWVPWGPEVTGGDGVVPFEVNVQVPDGGGETIGIADSYRGISGLRPGDSEYYNIPTGPFIIEMDQDSGWPEPEINCVGATAVQVTGFVATLTVGPSDNIRCEFIARKGATSLAITDVKYQCGIGFTATVVGDATPLYVTFSGESVPDANGSFSMPDFGTFIVEQAGPFLAPAELLDFTRFDPGPHPINVVIEDSAGGRVPVVEAAAAYISEECSGPVSVDLFDSVAFAFGDENVAGAGVPILRRIASILIQDNVEGITIVGHTDSIGDTAANQQLSEARAQAVANFLVSQGVPLANLTIDGQGETEPRADNQNADGSDNPEGRQQNRRVQIGWRLDS